MENQLKSKVDELELELKKTVEEKEDLREGVDE